MLTDARAERVIISVSGDAAACVVAAKVFSYVGQEGPRQGQRVDPVSVAVRRSCEGGEREEADSAALDLREPHGDGISPRVCFTSHSSRHSRERCVVSIGVNTRVDVAGAEIHRRETENSGGSLCRKLRTRVVVIVSCHFTRPMTAAALLPPLVS